MPIIRYLLVFGLLLQAGQILADIIEGRVIGVTDGNTISILDSAKLQHQIRLAGIDAPDSRQEFGEASKRYLTALVFGRDVRVEWKKHDRYGRIVGKVLVQPDGCSTCPYSRDAGVMQLEAGLAWWYREYRREQTLEDQGFYEYAEFDAKTQRRGLWSDPNPVPPWEWRKKNLIKT